MAARGEIVGGTGTLFIGQFISPLILAGLAVAVGGLQPALGVLGVPAGECRLPLGPAPAGTADAASSVLEELGYEL